jgi:hypothetical protein
MHGHVRSVKEIFAQHLLPVIGGSSEQIKVASPSCSLESSTLPLRLIIKMVVGKIFVHLLAGLLSIRAEKVRFWGRFAQPSNP